MTDRLAAAPPVDERLPLGFAHRGGPSHRAHQNTLRAFHASIALGATALESDVMLTADGVPVLSHPRVRDRFGRSVARTRRRDLPAAIPSLEDVYRECGTDLDLALDMTAPGAIDAVVDLARRHGDPTRLWITYWRVDAMRRWRTEYPDVQLVFPTLLPLRRRGEELVLAGLAEAGIDAVNLYHHACTPGRIQRIHEHGMLAFGWGARTGRGAARTLRHGADGVFCDDTAGMVAALHAARGVRPPLSAAVGS